MEKKPLSLILLVDDSEPDNVLHRLVIDRLAQRTQFLDSFGDLPSCNNLASKKPTQHATTG